MHSVERAIDLTLVAQRILKLAEIAMLEHLESLHHSQAEALMEICSGDADTV